MTPLPPAAHAHYRAFAWVVHEQRLMALLLGTVAAAVALVWMTAADVTRRPPLVIRAPASLRESAELLGGAAPLAYDQIAFFLLGCVPLLYAADEGQHPWLALAEGLVAPEICRAAEQRLQMHATEAAAHHLSQSLTLAAITAVAADRETGRAAATLNGLLRIATAAGVRNYPWRARVVVAANPGGKLNPYPYYLLSLTEESGP